MGTEIWVETGVGGSYTDKQENKIFLIYREIQNGVIAKSYMYD